MKMLKQVFSCVKALPTESLLDTMYNTFMSTMMTSKPVLIGLTKSTLKDRSINIIYAVRLACAGYPLIFICLRDEIYPSIINQSIESLILFANNVSRVEKILYRGGVTRGFKSCRSYNFTMLQPTGLQLIKGIFYTYN